MKIKAVFTALILCVCVLSGGCSLGLDDSSLLHPPKNTGREAKLESLIEQTAQESYKLKYPLSGLYRSAIITEDLNGDKKEEAIAFYRTEDDEKSTNLLVMYDKGGSWKVSGSFKLGYPDVDCVQFADYDYDGVKEIFTGFSSQGTGSNTLNIFNYDPENGKSSKEDFSRSYSAFTTGDYDKDGGSELLTFDLNSDQTDAQAVLTDYDNNELYILSKCDMDQNVIKFENINSGLLNKDTMGVTVDGIIENGYSSQVIYYNPDKMKLLNFPVTAGKKSISTVRNEKINCTDIDDDGFIEIPTVKSVSIKSVPESETLAPIINWSGINTHKNKLETKLKCVSDKDYGYYFILPESFSDTTVTTLSSDKRVMKIYKKDSDSADGLIVSFKVFDVGTSTDDMAGYSTIESYNQYIYAYKIEDDPPISVSGDTLKENFSLNDNSD